MATMVPAQKAVEYIFYVCLVSQADVNVMQSNPTLAGGDVTVTTDGNAVTNLDTLPAVDPGASAFVKVTVSGTEMNGDNIIILFNDAAGDEWCDLAISIQTANQSLDTTDTAVDGIQTDLSNGADGLGALKTLIEAVPTASEIQTEMEEDGDSLLDTIRDKTDNLPTDPADQSLIIAATDAIVAAIGALPEDADITTITDAIAALPQDADITAAVVAMIAGIAAAHTVTDAKIDSAQDDLDTLIAAALTEGTSLSTLIKILTNKWEITGNQLIMYDDDGTTPIYTFDLTRDGEPTEFNPKKRDPA